MQHSLLFNSIAKENSSGLANDFFLKQVTKEHPYFTPAQFYLLQQMQETDAAYNKQAAKTAVLFNNPHWLHFQLQQPDLVIVSKEEIATAIIPAAENTTNNDNTLVIEKQATTPEQIMLAQNNDNDDDEVVIEEEIAPIKINITIPKTNTGSDNAITFEPMHLVDYFASQGIKLSEEVQPADKLGNQLKSFTAWLKTMKKIHNPAVEANSGISDMVIQTLAAKSNTEGEIVTEAMAEVLSQQGKMAKAIEVYKKLSLLNPSKNAYFAAKIEQLKGL
jgi:hypothetical protein